MPSNNTAFAYNRAAVALGMRIGALLHLLPEIETENKNSPHGQGAALQNCHFFAACFGSWAFPITDSRKAPAWICSWKFSRRCEAAVRFGLPSPSSSIHSSAGFLLPQPGTEGSSYKPDTEQSRRSQRQDETNKYQPRSSACSSTKSSLWKGFMFPNPV